MAATIRIWIRPFADLGRLFPGEGSPRELEVRAGSTVGDLLAAHGLDGGPRLTIGVNEKLARRDTPLASGDVVDILVPVSGG